MGHVTPRRAFGDVGCPGVHVFGYCCGASVSLALKPPRFAVGMSSGLSEAGGRWLLGAVVFVGYCSC